MRSSYITRHHLPIRKLKNRLAWDVWNLRKSGSETAVTVQTLLFKEQMCFMKPLNKTTIPPQSAANIVSRRIPELSITRLAMCTVAAVVTDGEKWLPGALKQRNGLAGCEEMLCLVRVDHVQLRKTSRRVSAEEFDDGYIMVYYIN